MNTFYYNSSYIQRRRKHQWLKIVIWLMILVAMLSTGYNFWQTHLPIRSASLIAPIMLASPTATPTTTVMVPGQHSLESVVQDALQGTSGTYGVVIKNLRTGQSYSFNPHVQFESASLYKLWVMAVVYQQIQAGQLSEDQVLSEDVTTLNQEFNIDLENAELTDGTITLTVKDAVHQMITISNNYAAMLLTEKIGLASLQSFLKQYGFNESIVGINGDAPITTASDIALFYEKLYQGDLANSQYTAEMVETLKEQTLNAKIPSSLPDDVDVAHKTGELDNYSHDGGIVYTPKGNYIIVVMSENEMPSAANDRIANISEAVYNYFQNE